MRLIDADDLIHLLTYCKATENGPVERGYNAGLDHAIARVKQMPSVEPTKPLAWERGEEFE